ncbi:SDR family oxidoreductase [Nakamurella endophytica]|uniref:SDR family oxidoreductase n=1 Tax=Nakamurella endophytica TaxID=1748367 RepID=UPI001E389765|nr:SDR family oxidoreductase [Nakamurella endophytica]
MSLQGKVAVVTGASSGIGRSLARALAAARADVVLVGRDGQRLAAVADGLDGVRTLTVAADLGEPGRADDVVTRTLEAFGRLDVVLSNAGLYLGGDFAEVDVTAMHTLLSTNVFGAFAVVRAALPHLLAQGRGDVVLTSSVSGAQDIHWEPVYSASKHAVDSFVHTVRRQLAGTGVRVGGIAPGIVLNELWGYPEGSPERAAEIESGRGITSEDVADAVLYMLTRPRHVTIRDLVILPAAQEI